MKPIKICLFLLLISQLTYSLEKVDPLQPPKLQHTEFLEVWDSKEGLTRLHRSASKENFWKLLRFYESQIRITYCGVAASVIALNALGIEAPKSNILKNYSMFTQEEFFTDNVKAVIDPLVVEERGMCLQELAHVLKTFPVEVYEFEAQHLSIDTIRELIVEALKHPNQCILALYQRKELMQIGGGHWSPIAAYDEQSDSFLILDVAKYKYPPVWINTTALIKAMQTFNNNNQSRGFIIISRPNDPNCYLLME